MDRTQSIQLSHPSWRFPLVVRAAWNAPEADPGVASSMAQSSAPDPCSVLAAIAPEGSCTPGNPRSGTAGVEGWALAGAKGGS